MTIDGLNALTTLTAGDELPVWDVEASAEEPTKKITAQNMAASVKSLGSLIGTGDLDSTPTQGSNKAVTSGGTYTAIQQSTATAWLKKRENITVTTDANGNAQIQSVPGDPIKVLLFAWDGSHIFIPFYYNNTWYCRVQYTNAAGNILASTSVTFSIYYVS